MTISGERCAVERYLPWDVLDKFSNSGHRRTLRRGRGYIECRAPLKAARLSGGKAQEGSFTECCPPVERCAENEHCAIERCLSGDVVDRLWHVDAALASVALGGAALGTVVQFSAAV